LGTKLGEVIKTITFPFLLQDDSLLI
jgi:hypothetical protein